MTIDNLPRRLLIAFLFLLPLWTFSKIPFYLGFKNDGNASDPYGLELSINLEHWITGYHSSKLRCPPFNFILIHVAMGSMVLVLTALTLINKSWRLKYGKYFFIAGFILGLHSVPASILQVGVMYWVFMFANVMCMGLSIWGWVTLRDYDKDPIKADRNLMIQYGVICAIASTAAFLEITNILKRFSYKREHGEFEVVSDIPHPLYGNTFYDNFPESIGLAIFSVWVVVVMFAWPIGLLNLNGGYQALDNAVV
jgi:hypothetical protein